MTAFGKLGQPDRKVLFIYLHVNQTDYASIMFTIRLGRINEIINFQETSVKELTSPIIATKEPFGRPRVTWCKTKSFSTSSLLDQAQDASHMATAISSNLKLNWPLKEGDEGEPAVCSSSAGLCSEQDRNLLNRLVDIMAWDKDEKGCSF